MRLPLLLSALCALCIDCGATDESGDEFGTLRQALGDTPIVETFSGTLARNTTASRGPFAVQPGSRLSVVLSGTGDADLYVRFGSRPSTSVYDCRPYTDTSAEQCVLTVPASATTVYVDVRGYSSTSSYSLQIERVAGGDGAGGTGGSSGSGGSSGTGGSSGSSGAGGSSGASGTSGTGGSAGSSGGTGGGSSGGSTITETFSGTLAQNATDSRGPFAVLPGSQLSAVLSGTGDADLYVRFGSRPSTSSWDCRPYAETAAEQCVLTVPASATTVYVDVRGYTASTYALQIQRVADAGSTGSGGTGGSGGGGSAGTGGSGQQGNEPFLIAVLGSSTAEGEGASSVANSWVGLLESSLSSAASVSISNLATGGYTTLELMSGSGAPGNIDAALQEHPDLILVALAGSNDLSIGTSAVTYLSRLGQLRDKARAAGVPTFFVGTAPKDLSDSERFELADWNQQMRGSFASCWVPASSSYSPCFIDIFSQLADSDLQIAPQYEGGDGIHLNDAGHRVIFNQAVAVIEPYLCTVMDCH